MEDTRISEINVGGDVADFIGSMLEKTDSGYEHQTLNPRGINRFGDKTPEEMVREYAAGHGDSLELLLQRVEDIFKDDEEKPDFYTQTVEAIQQEIAKNKGN